MEQNIVDIETLRRAIIDRDEQNHIKLISNEIAVVSDLQMDKFRNIMQVDMWAFVLCLSGTCKLSLNHMMFDIRRGTMLVYQPNQRFKMEQLSSDCTGKILFVTREVVDESVAKIPDIFNFLLYVEANPCVQLTESQCDMFLRYGQLVLMKAGDANNLFYREISTNLMMALFFEVFNIYSRNLVNRSTVKTAADYVFERFLQLVVKHYIHERSIKYYAGLMGLSPKYLSQICYRVSGRHAGVWIDRFVVAKAKSLLLDTNLTIQQIANELNFANQSFFGKFFSKHVGQSPSKFRKCCR